MKLFFYHHPGIVALHILASSCLFAWAWFTFWSWLTLEGYTPIYDPPTATRLEQEGMITGPDRFGRKMDWQREIDDAKGGKQ